MKLHNKVVLITGASRGIGCAIAKECARQGARIIVHYKSDRTAAEETLHSLRGESHVLVQADISKPEDAERLVKDALEQTGRIDVLVNNAGMFLPHPFPVTSYTDWLSSWNQIISTNLFGAANVSYWVIHQMIRQGGGRIINVSSRGAFRGEPESPAYGASKAGMNAMSQSLAKALAPHKILVFAVAPGFVETERIAQKTTGAIGDEIRAQSPFNRMATPEEVAQTVLFLASEAPEFLTGGIIDINGASYLRS
jgi:NAD(P)-dependent dehydrogenase (short-subunit alcohol dehydrogenase family)